MRLPRGFCSISLCGCLISGAFSFALTHLPTRASAQSGPRSSVANPPAKLAFRPADPLNAQAFDHFYNMEYDRSIPEFTQILQRHADDADAVNHLLNTVLFAELYRIGALNAAEYANDSFVNAAHRPADKRTCDQIKSLVQKAQAIEEKRLAANSKDASAFYARGVTKAQFATYTALIEHAWFSALRNAVGARHDHEKVLELDPHNPDAKLIVGAHNYVVGSLPWGAKGLGREAEAIYRKVWQDGRNERYAGLHYEIVAIALGDLLRSEKNYAGAAVAYDLVAQVPKPEPETAQKAAVDAGEMYDLLKNRDLALKRYQAAMAVDSGSPLAETARKRIKEPYSGS